jgi:undecaprenyl diphosphate synthase
VIGERGRVDGELLGLIDEAQTLTRGNQVLTLVIAFNYGARAEIASAARRLADRVRRGEIDPGAITEAMLAQELDTAGIPDPDLLIRTSGEQRLSNFLLWQAAYAELVFMDVKWPDFGRDQLLEAISIFQARDRRFGGLAKEVLGS